MSCENVFYILFIIMLKQCFGAHIKLPKSHDFRKLFLNVNDSPLGGNDLCEPMNHYSPCKSETIKWVFVVYTLISVQFY